MIGSALSVAACGQLHVDADDDDTSDVDASRRRPRDAGEPTDGSKQDPRRPRDAGKDADDNEFVDPECPDRPPPVVQYDCDPIRQIGCETGEQCAPIVDYPQDPCEAETYASLCVPAGTLTQDQTCQSQLDCAAGYICLITGAGTTCGRACDLNEPNGCSNGLICVETDVSGIGACN